MTKRTKKTGGPKRDIMAEVTNRMIEALEAGVAPWVKPWTGDAGYRMPGGSMPRNGATGREYRGGNVLILWLTGSARGYVDPRWLTFKQAKDLGGSVRKGERGTQIVFWKFFKKEETNAKGETKEKTIPMVRTYTVFNVEQCEGLDKIEPVLIAESPGTVADQVADEAGAKVVRMGARACYSLLDDMITIPAIEAFESEAAYASTLFHELTHWTGPRLDREFGKRFGDDAYAAEELVAELGSAFLCARHGVEGRLQHAEYLGHWLAILKADKYALFTAAREAQKALDLLAPIEAGADEGDEGDEGEAKAA